MFLAVMALERVPADIRAEGGVARMSDPTMIKEIKETVTIPVMAKVGTVVLARIFVTTMFLSLVFCSLFPTLVMYGEGPLLVDGYESRKI
jgi:predicted neutral ceramidase superfamily lipid hydrolase